MDQQPIGLLQPVVMLLGQKDKLFIRKGLQLINDLAKLFINRAGMVPELITRRDKMEINLTIAKNDSIDNHRYADAMSSKIAELYPDASVSVSLTDDPDGTVCHVTGSKHEHDYDRITGSDYDVAEHVGRLLPSVLDSGNF